MISNSNAPPSEKSNFTRDHASQSKVNPPQIPSLETPQIPSLETIANEILSNVLKGLKTLLSIRSYHLMPSSMKHSRMLSRDLKHHLQQRTHLRA
ncbi:hypothetical protein M0R45_028190 [Rubus argutus]|uniref:Uncharacterized protein n=1 Tax=Rubus argutus TaxID=59490 RepID=A0AAW1W811_RUBAR